MTFSDIHIHALFGCDDGPKRKAQMYELVDRAYVSGTRLMCLTPHYHPRGFGDNRERTERAFEHLCQYVRQRYPDLLLCLGNELRWDHAALHWLEEGHCRTMNGGRYVLVDFRDTESRETIENGLYRLLSGGYVPILAHAERYRSLVGNQELLRSFRQKGIVLQMDAGAPLGQFGFLTKLWSGRLLKAGLIDVICSDAHDTKDRLPNMAQAYEPPVLRQGREGHRHHQFQGERGENDRISEHRQKLCRAGQAGPVHRWRYAQVCRRGTAHRKQEPGRSE